MKDMEVVCFLTDKSIRMMTGSLTNYIRAMQPQITNMRETMLHTHEGREKIYHPETKEVYS